MIERGSGRRVFLTRAGGLVLTLGSSPVWGLGARALPRSPYQRGVWLSGDHHIHTHFSYDGMYSIADQVAAAQHHGLDFCVITDHGGPGHDRVLLQTAYPQLVEARRKHPGILVFQGLEWNIPAAEHGSIILPPTADEAEQIAAFEAQFDERNTGSKKNPTPKANTEAAAVAGVRYLQERIPKAVFFANHPARRGIDSPHELRDWSDAGPTVMRGFEGAPGHGAAPLVNEFRGAYGDHPSAGAFPGYPLHSYRTWGGYDYYVAQVGGLWDSLLSEGRAFYITANSDSHRWYGDRTAVDRTTYHTHGYVTQRPDQPKETLLAGNPAIDEDFPPGAYARTWVYAERREPLAVLEAMRAGNMFTALGGVIESLELWLHDGVSAVPMGSALRTERGRELALILRLRLPERKNLGGHLPVLHHVDVIAGDIVGKAADRDTMLCPSARVLAQLPLAAFQRQGSWATIQFRLPRAETSSFVRVRGTNTDVVSPRLDLPPEKGRTPIDPFTDLWFYSNPIQVYVRS